MPRELPTPDDIAKTVKDAVDKDAKPPVNGKGDGSDDGDDEARARHMGWRPQDEYRGPKDDWLPAAEFVDKVEAEVPMLRERNRFLSDQLTKQEHKMEEQGTKIDEMSNVLKEFNDHNKDAEERAYERARSDLQSEMRASVEEGDTESYESAEKQLKVLDDTKKDRDKKVSEPAKVPAQQASPAEQKFVDENQDLWRIKPAQRMFIDHYSENRDNGMSEDAALADAKVYTERKFADELGITPPDNEDEDQKPSARKRRSDPPAVNKPTAGRSRSGQRAKTFDNLPKEAQEACERFEGLIPDYNREEYVKSYDWGPEYGD